MNLWERLRAGQWANTQRFLRPQWKSLKSLFAGRRWGSMGHWWCWTGKLLSPYWLVPSGTWTPGPYPHSSGCLWPPVPAKGSSARSLWSLGYRKGIKAFTRPGEEPTLNSTDSSVLQAISTQPKNLQAPKDQGQDLATLSRLHPRTSRVQRPCGWVSLGNPRVPGPGESTNRVLWDANETLM